VDLKTANACLRAESAVKHAPPRKVTLDPDASPVRLKRSSGRSTNPGQNHRTQYAEGVGLLDGRAIGTEGECYGILLSAAECYNVGTGRNLPPSSACPSAAQKGLKARVESTCQSLLFRTRGFTSLRFVLVFLGGRGRGPGLHSGRERACLPRQLVADACPQEVPETLRRGPAFSPQSRYPPRRPSGFWTSFAMLR